MIEATGTIANKASHSDEDIEVFLMDVNEIKELLASDKKIAAKAWGLFYHYAQNSIID